MGLINNDVFEANNGVQKAGTYISFNNETLYLRRINQNDLTYPPQPMVTTPTDISSSEKKYMVNANYRVFWDKAARDAGKPFLELRSVSAQVVEADLTANLYEVLYAELKKQYVNSVDELATRSVAPAQSSSSPSSSTDSSSVAPSTDSSSSSGSSSADSSSVAPSSDSSASSSSSSTDSSSVAPSTDSSSSSSSTDSSSVAPSTDSSSSSSPSA